MEIEINNNSPEPVYEQIERQIVKAVCLEQLVPGDSLPPIRQLANDLELNHNTVAKAYKLLESQRVIHTAGRKGTFIQPEALANIKLHQQQQAIYQLKTLAASFQSRGMTHHEINQLLSDCANGYQE